MGLNPRLTAEAAKQRLERIRARQYLRSLLCYQIEADEQPGLRTLLWSNYEEYQRLTTHYFGLRILITDRAEWSTAQIIEAYRGQSRAEAAFRDMKDPHMLSTRPQFHWIVTTRITRALLSHSMASCSIRGGVRQSPIRFLFSDSSGEVALLWN